MMLDEILYTVADFELDERHVALVPNEKVALADFEFDRTYFLFYRRFLFSANTAPYKQ